MAAERDDYDSPWKEAVEQYFPEFMEFFFPAAHKKIDWAKGHVFLDKELQAVVQDAELGRRYLDKLVGVTLLTGEEDWIYIHVEVQGNPEAKFGERIFVYNYRLFDRYRRPVASMVVLADDSPSWRPDGFGYEMLGFQISVRFPAAKLLDYAGQEEALLAHPNPFALVTAAHLMARATRDDMAARYDAKWRLVRSLYQRGWDRQRVIDLFAILDWLMRLPEGLAQELRSNIEVLEEREKMRYVTSVERLAINDGIQQGEALLLIRLLEMKFGPVGSKTREQIKDADVTQIEAWFERAVNAPSAEAALGGDVVP